MSTAEPAVVRMGHDLVRNLGHLPPETATMEIATHIRKFWEPRMRHELLARIRWGDTRPVTSSTVRSTGPRSGSPPAADDTERSGLPGDDDELQPFGIGNQEQQPLDVHEHPSVQVAPDRPARPLGVDS